MFVIGDRVTCLKGDMVLILSLAALLEDVQLYCYKCIALRVFRPIVNCLLKLIAVLFQYAVALVGT